MRFNFDSVTDCISEINRCIPIHTNVHGKCVCSFNSHTQFVIKWNQIAQYGWGGGIYNIVLSCADKQRMKQMVSFVTILPFLSVLLPLTDHWHWPWWFPEGKVNMDEKYNSDIKFLETWNRTRHLPGWHEHTICYWSNFYAHLIG